MNKISLRICLLITAQLKVVLATTKKGYTFLSTTTFNLIYLGNYIYIVYSTSDAFLVKYQYRLFNHYIIIYTI